MFVYALYATREELMAPVTKAMWLRVAKALGVSVIVLVGLTLIYPDHPAFRTLWVIIAFLVTLFYLRFRDDWYGRP
jgi:hypothetical protein